MIKQHSETILNLILLIGLAIYILQTATSSLSNTIIWTIFVLYIWVFSSLYFSKFNFQKLIKICCCVGVLFSLTFFLSFGLEEIPYPEGAIMFHSKPIAISLIIFFISSIPLLYKIADNPKGCSNKSAKTLSSQEKENDNEGWEEATLEDLESGKYDPI